MNWTNKLYTLRAEALEELRKVLREKDYDKTELSGQEMYELPYIDWKGDLSADTFSIVSYDKTEECFMARSWYSSEIFWFYFDELDTQCICNLIDLINEENEPTKL